MNALMQKAKDMVSDVAKPEASIQDWDLKDVSRHGVTYLAKVIVTNPYSVSVPVCDIKYTLKSANKVIASGEIPDPGSLKGKDTTNLDVGVKIPHSMIASLVKDIGADWDIDYHLEVGLVIDIPVVGNITVPLSRKGEMKLPSLKDML